MTAPDHRDVIFSRAKRSWLGSVFGTVPVDPTRRSIGDVARVAIAALGVYLCLRSVPGLSTLDDVLLTANEDLSGWVDGLLSAVYWVGIIVPALTIVLASLATRRWRLLVVVAASVAATAIAGVLLGANLDLASSSQIDRAGYSWNGGDPSLPVGALSVAAAIVFGALPFLMRPTRLISLGALLVAVPSAAVVTVSLPGAVIASALLGWGAAALAHLALGAPEGGPAPSDVTAALAEIGVPVTDLERVIEDEPSQRLFHAVSESGEHVSVVVIGRDATRYQTSRELVRRLWYKRSGPTPAATRLSQVEHRTLLLLLAERAGVAVPQLVAVGTAGPNDDALQITVAPPGTPLDELDGYQVTDGVLDDVWRNVTRLHDAGLVHGSLRAHHIVVDGDGSTVLVDFSSASPAGRGARIDVDEAALLVATAAIVGADRALAAYELVRGPEALAALLPVLESAALPASVRRSTKGTRQLVKRLREEAADMVGVEPPQLEELRRVSPGNIAMAIGGLIGVYLVVGELSSAGGMRSILQGADLWWVLVVLLLSQTPQLAQAIAMLGSVVQRIPLGSATAVQFANQFMGLVGGTVATTALVIRYFQRLGLGAAIAISSAVLNTVATMVTQSILVIAGLWLSRGDWQRTGFHHRRRRLHVRQQPLDAHHRDRTRHRGRTGAPAPTPPGGDDAATSCEGRHREPAGGATPTRQGPSALRRQRRIAGPVRHDARRRAPGLRRVAPPHAAHRDQLLRLAPRRHHPRSWWTRRDRGGPDRRIHGCGDPSGTGHRGHVHRPALHRLPATSLGLGLAALAPAEGLRLSGQTSHRGFALRRDPAGWRRCRQFGVAVRKGLDHRGGTDRGSPPIASAAVRRAAHARSGTAVDHEGRARAVGALVGGQEQRQRSDLLGSAHPGDRLVRDVGRRGLLTGVSDEAGGDGAGMDGVHPDAVGTELERCDLRQTRDGELGGDVGSEIGCPNQTPDRRHVDDGTAAAGPHRTDRQREVRERYLPG